jgi:hypothetical protein
MVERNGPLIFCDPGLLPYKDSNDAPGVGKALLAIGQDWLLEAGAEFVGASIYYFVSLAMESASL